MKSNQEKHLDKIMAEDHDQAERDYYDSINERRFSHCLYSIKALALISVGYFFLKFVKYLTE